MIGDGLYGMRAPFNWVRKTQHQHYSTSSVAAVDPAITDGKALLYSYHRSGLAVFASQLVLVDVAKVALVKLKGNREKGVKSVSRLN